MDGANTVIDAFHLLVAWLPTGDYDFQALVYGTLFFLCGYCFVRVTADLIHLVRR